MIFRSIILLVLTPLLLLPTASNAKSVSDSMEGFWNDVGGAYSNGTEAGGYQLQGAGYYTGGGFSARNKVVNVNPISIIPPGIRAGCGGIDVYTGSFSYINTDQFVSLAKAIPSVATGFSFQLALETLSPAIKGTVDQLQSIIDKVNSTNLNSCDLAQGLVGGALAATGKSGAYCKTTANSQGWATDYAKAANECSTGGRSADYINRADSVHGDQRPVNINIAWEVLKKSQILSGSPSGSSGSSSGNELAQFVMALTGTMIIKAPRTESAGAEVIYKPNIATDSDTIKSMLEGGSLTILSCDENDKCLNPTARTITLPANKSFRKRIAVLMGEMTNRISTGEKFDAKHIDLVNKTSLPIHKAMILRQAYYGSSTAASGLNPEHYSTFVAIDLLYRYLDEILKTVQQQTSQIQNFDQKNIEKFEQNLIVVREEISKYKIDDQNSYKQANDFIQSTQKVQSMVSAQMGTKMKNSINWTKGL